VAFFSLPADREVGTMDFRGGRLLGATTRGGANAFGFLDLNHAAVMNGQLHRAEAHIAKSAQDFIVRQAFMVGRRGGLSKFA
jgi:hypothetical protein